MSSLLVFFRASGGGRKGEGRTYKTRVAHLSLVPICPRHFGRRQRQQQQQQQQRRRPKAGGSQHLRVGRKKSEPNKTHRKLQNYHVAGGRLFLRCTRTHPLHTTAYCIMYKFLKVGEGYRELKRAGGGKRSARILGTLKQILLLFVSRWNALPSCAVGVTMYSVFGITSQSRLRTERTQRCRRPPR